MLKNYFSYKGRIGRMTFAKSYFGVIAFYLLAVFIIGFVSGIFGMTEKIINEVPLALGLVSLLLVSFPIVKRFHDINTRAFAILAFLIPLVNFIALIYLFFQKGTVGDNKFGSDPLGGTKIEHETEQLIEPEDKKAA